MQLIALLRVSGLTQENNTSLEYQMQRIQQWASLNNATIVYVVCGVESATAEASKRPYLQHALQVMAQLNADGIVAFDIDRLFRNVAEALVIYRHAFEKTGKRLIAVQQSFDASTLEGWFVFVQFLLFAEYAGRKQNARMAQGKACTRAKGGYTGGSVPYGYYLDSEGQLQPSDAEQEVIQVVRKLNLEGLGATACATKLNALGYRKRSGANWNSCQVQRLLNALAS